MFNDWSIFLLSHISMNKHKTTFSYQIGGSLAGKSPSYVERKADCQLEEALKQGEFCFVLRDILFWTGGQPFLTQKLCQLVVEKGNKKLGIEEIIETYIINNWEAQDEPEHLRTIRDRICYRDSSKTIRLLGLYREILQQGKISVNNSPEYIELRLSGLVVERQ